LEAVADLDEFTVAQLLLLVRSHTRLRTLTQAVTLDGFRQNDRRPAVALHGAVITVKHFQRIQAAAPQTPNLVVGHVLDKLEQFGVLAKKLLAQVRAIAAAEGLIFAVHAFMHAFEQQAAGIARQQIVPVAAPNDFDDVPPSAQEDECRHP